MTTFINIALNPIFRQPFKYCMFIFVTCVQIILTHIKPQLLSAEPGGSPTIRQQSNPSVYYNSTDISTNKYGKGRERGYRPCALARVRKKRVGDLRFVGAAKI